MSRSWWALRGGVCSCPRRSLRPFPCASLDRGAEHCARPGRVVLRKPRNRLACGLLDNEAARKGAPVRRRRRRFGPGGARPRGRSRLRAVGAPGARRRFEGQKSRASPRPNCAPIGAGDRGPAERSHQRSARACGENPLGRFHDPLAFFRAPFLGVRMVENVLSMIDLDREGAGGNVEGLGHGLSHSAIVLPNAHGGPVYHSFRQGKGGEWQGANIDSDPPAYPQVDCGICPRVGACLS